MSVNTNTLEQFIAESDNTSAMQKASANQAKPTPATPKVVGAQKQGQAQAKQAQAQAKQAQAQAQKAQQAAASLAAKQNDQAIRTTETVIDKIGDATQDINSWAESVPKVGGLFLVVAILFLFLWMIVPVNGGYTRFQLLYFTLTGRTAIAGSSTSATNAEQEALNQAASNPSGALTPDLSQLIQDFGSIL